MTCHGPGSANTPMRDSDINNLATGKYTPLNQVILQMPGFTLDQNQEIHIRGEHMGIQYQINGIMRPLDINTDPTFTPIAQFVPGKKREPTQWHSASQVRLPNRGRDRHRDEERLRPIGLVPYTILSTRSALCYVDRPFSNAQQSPGHICSR